MNSGIFINHELLTLITTSKKGNLQYSGFDGDNEVYMYFLFDKTQKPPVKLHQELRQLYYTGHPEITSEILKFANGNNDRIKVNGKKIHSFDLLNQYINQILTDNKNLLFEKGSVPDGSSFNLMVPPYLGEKLTNSLVKTVQRIIKPVTLINYLFPLLNYLLEENKLPEKGNVLYIEMGFSEIHFQLISTSPENNGFEIKIEGEDQITDTKLLLRTIQLVAEEMVELAFHEFGFAADNTLLNKQNEIQHLIPYAQDILTELNAVENFKSIEVDLELSDSSSGTVLIQKEKLVDKFSKILEEEGLKAKMIQLIKKLEPESVVLNGEFLNNPLLLDFFTSYQGVNIVKHQPDYHKIICRTVFEGLAKMEEKVEPEEKALEVINVETVEAEVISAEVINMEPFVESQKIRKRKGVLAKILIPVIIIIAAFLIYKFYPFDGEKSNPTINDKIVPLTMEFGPNAGETQTINIQSSGEWQVQDIPDWLTFNTLKESGSEEIIVTTSVENKAIDSKEASIQVVFENNESKYIEIVQLGSDEETEDIPEIIAEEVDQIPEAIPVVDDKTPAVIEKIEFVKWNFDDLNLYIESIGGSTTPIDFDRLFINIDPKCEVFYYINGEKLSSEDIRTFINKIKLGGTEKLVPNSIKYNDQEKIIEFGQE